MRTKKQSLKDWIDKTGTTEVSELLQVGESTVRQWRRGFCLPRAEQMREIKRLTNGSVDYDEMIDGHFETKRV